MDWQFVVSACKLRNCLLSRDDGKGGNTLHRKRFQVIASKEEDDIRFGFIQDFPELTHSRDTGIEHFRFFIGWPNDQLWRVNRATCGNNFPHIYDSFELIKIFVAPI